MKLVEILARDLKKWRGVWLFCAQSTDGQIFFDNEKDDEDNFERGEFLEKATDMETARITRDQWEAERSRIAAMEGVSAAPEQANAEAEREAEDWRNERQKQYEQELWDKVAIERYISKINSADPKFGETWNDIREASVDAAFASADTFMEERARRLKEQK